MPIASPSKPAARPNVVLIICDDLAWGDLSCYGNPHLQTPHLDAIYTQSARLHRHCSGPLCTPARASLMTGRYPFRTRAFDTYCGRSMMDADEITLPEVLRGAGYRTGIFGKWHLGDNYPMRAMDKGFEEALVHNGGGLRQPGNIGHYAGRDGYFDPELMHNGTPRTVEGYCTDIFTDAALDYMEARRGEEFFVYLAFNAPHSPFEIGPDWTRPLIEAGVPPQWAPIYGMIAGIDWNVGRLMQHLRALNLSDDTLVIFTSDHGPCGSAMAEGQSRFNAGLRAIKGTMYEGGIRVPCLWQWPGHFPVHDVTSVSNPIDFLPTLAAICGAPLPTERALDGVDLSAALRGETEATARQIFMQWHRGDQPVRFRNCAVTGDRWKWTRPHESAPDELYDVLADPGEARDVSAQEPERTRRIRADYERWFDEVSQTRADNFAPPRIVIGSPHENPTVLTRQDWRVNGRPDGWGDQDLGHWEVEITRAGPFDIELQFSPLAPTETLHLRVGPVEHSANETASQQSHRFERVTLPLGHHRLEAWIKNAGERRGVRFVSIEATGP